jgi:hypothetical protein
MKKLLAAFVGLIGIAWLRKRAEQPPAADPADELRAKLAEQRDPEPEPEPEPEGETGAQGDVESRRSEVHDRARQAIEDLSTPEE